MKPKASTSRWHRRLRKLAVVAVALACTGTSACSAGSSSSSGGDGPLVVAHPFPITGLDLTGPLSGDRTALTINRQIFDSLTRIDEETGELQPWLATEWEVVDGKDWRFTLRDDVKFSNGDDLTSEDVKATIDALMKAGTPLAPIFDGVTGVDAPDATTVVLHARRRLAALPRNVALLGIAPADGVDDPDFMKNPVGSGKFTFDSFTGSELTLAANREHWDGPPKVDTLVFKDIPEATARVAALETGEVDVTWGIPPDLFTSLQDGGSVQTETVPGFLNYEVLVNWNRPPLDDLKVRQALVHAIDPEPIIDNVLGGLGEPARAPLAQTIFGTTELKPLGYNPDRAKQLLEEAGQPNLKLTMLLRPQEIEDQVALAMVSQWAEAGIDVKPQTKELAAWTDAYVEQDFDLALTIRPTLSGDADYTLGRLYTEAAARVPCANPQLDKPIMAAGTAIDDAAREASYEKALQYMWENVCGVYPIDVSEAYAWSNSLSGFVPASSSIPLFDDVEKE